MKLLQKTLALIDAVLMVALNLLLQLQSQSVMPILSEDIVVYNIKIFFIVPDIIELEDVTVAYSDDLTATFTCTAFGGVNEDLVFTWIAPNDATDFDDDTQVETLNADNTITSTITTLPLQLSDRMQIYTCDVAYDSFPNRDNESFATLNIGKIITIYDFIHFLTTIFPQCQLLP